MDLHPPYTHCFLKSFLAPPEAALLAVSLFVAGLLVGAQLVDAV